MKLESKLLLTAKSNTALREVKSVVRSVKLIATQSDKSAASTPSRAMGAAATDSKNLILRLDLGEADVHLIETNRLCRSLMRVDNG